MEVKIRELEAGDIWNGFLETLDHLKPTSGIRREKAEEVFRMIDSNPDHIVLVAEAGGSIVGTGSIFIDHKFIHNGGRVGHIEDTVVSGEYQKRGIGDMLMDALVEISAGKGCYKTALNCPDHIIPFQVRRGFKVGLQNMRYDH
ncbi:putative glucosamine 6-phosphate N-acetyltransferase [Nitrosopumilaceae archaeon]|nr:GNAT family N-acetyltransferase [Nitrosopumilus sp.]CAI9830923.1 putative glucosamine 6-phosphate N-acetyltransferase [Nitrosopumilaceae archaeon]MDA7944913.1 GNAT family N-acetyltransferase [Nitrosopumilus sp.]MDA7954713.1 GNAT family N-acetyltransferase [Nitrosopumilus sp.]MDA7973613.1 GNAT family N-acetyltransferase [Nitrosopumilus sp.]